MHHARRNQQQIAGTDFNLLFQEAEAAAAPDLQKEFTEQVIEAGRSFLPSPVGAGDQQPPPAGLQQPDEGGERRIEFRVEPGRHTCRRPAAG